MMIYALDFVENTVGTKSVQKQNKYPLRMPWINVNQTQ